MAASVEQLSDTRPRKTVNSCWLWDQSEKTVPNGLGEPAGTAASFSLRVRHSLGNLLLSILAVMNRNRILLSAILASLVSFLRSLKDQKRTRVRKDSNPTCGTNLVFAVPAKTGTRRKVVQRDDDLLTPQQLQENWKEVQAARLKELKTWQELICFSRKLRRDARNIIDTRWVIKFKWVQQNGAWICTIRARLTVRGFKDSGKFDVDRYAGTSSRSSQ